MPSVIQRFKAGLQDIRRYGIGGDEVGRKSDVRRNAVIFDGRLQVRQMPATRLARIDSQIDCNGIEARNALSRKPSPLETAKQQLLDFGKYLSNRENLKFITISDRNEFWGDAEQMASRLKDSPSKALFKEIAQLQARADARDVARAAQVSVK